MLNGGLHTHCTRVCTVLLKQVVRTPDVCMSVIIPTIVGTFFICTYISYYKHTGPSVVDYSIYNIFTPGCKVINRLVCSRVSVYRKYNMTIFTF